MTRWQKFAWALGYFALSVLVPLAYLFIRNNVLLVLPGTSIFTGWVIAAFSDIPVLRSATLLVLLAMLAGLVITLIFAAFRRYLPLYVLLVLDVAARGLMITHAFLEEDSLGTLTWLIPGLLVSIAALAATVYLFRRPERADAEKSA